MSPINLTECEWLDIDPTFRAVIDQTPHVVAYDETDDELHLLPVSMTPARSPRRELATA